MLNIALFPALPLQSAVNGRHTDIQAIPAHIALGSPRRDMISIALETISVSLKYHLPLAVFLILIKNYHAENHSGQKPLYTKQIRLSGYVISHQKQISENKCGMVIHNYIMASQDHQ